METESVINWLRDKPENVAPQKKSGRERPRYRSRGLHDYTPPPPERPVMSVYRSAEGTFNHSTCSTPVFFLSQEGKEKKYSCRNCHLIIYLTKKRESGILDFTGFLEAKARLQKELETNSEQKSEGPVLPEYSLASV